MAARCAAAASSSPASSSASVTVLAPDAMTADVVATVVGVMEPVEGVRFVETLSDATAAGPIEGWIVDPSGGVRHVAP